MGIIVVEICDSNLIHTVDVEGLLESEYPEVAVITNSCLSFCGMCALRPYAIVNGKKIFGQTAEECLSKIKDRIELELALYKL
ncbi:DUF1450 domain-containing protein [Shouchella clausii]|uniref:DUF1450 domain-containing protein n=3 Tax=Shouchella TaxID=2893057 RepID=Q5WD51_SHOC1|nr:MULTISPECIES: DUF1450 domain-containing protein [Shouchella]MCM3313087.1 YuzB family protein [Psychrobacillus sp. MER TA 17]ALA53933.1 hypothetical protein DB29_03105 [Shouchella clausii]KKI87364.1 hypothetical protein WZ76_05750 [Shouchella clausii]MBU3229509.1 YuzB family protein [Shouchella clausii]MBU3265268.1 YuzB family protein [Shouchella clausii]